MADEAAARLLGHLREEAATLVETELPSEEEIRPILGALVSALARVAGDAVDTFRAPERPASDATNTVPVTSAPPVPATAPAEAAAAQAPTADTPLSDAEVAQLRALEERQANAQANARGGEQVESTPPPADAEPVAPAEPPAPTDPHPTEG